MAVSTGVEMVRIRTDEFDRMTEIGLFEDRHVELVEGTLYEMPPMGTAHLVALVALQQMLTSFNAQGRLLVQVPVQVPEFNEPEPGLAVLRTPLGLRKPTAADCLVVIEVSDSTLEFDRTLKIPAYRRGGTPEVWVLNLRDRQLEVTTDEGTHVYGADRKISHDIEGVVIDVSAVLARVRG